MSPKQKISHIASFLLFIGIFATTFNATYMNPSFAIIDRNTLSSITLKNMLCSIYDQVDVIAYATITDYIIDSNRHFVHFFVSEDILFEEAEEFEMLKSQTTVISCGGNAAIEKAGYRVLDCTLPENELACRLMSVHENWRRDPGVRAGNITDMLSQREKEVLIHIVKGFMNKEIAERLNISLPTAVFHRNNLCSKLETRSIGKLTVYAVLGGLIELNEI